MDEWGRRGLELAGENLDKIVEICREWKCQLTLVVYPWPDNVRGGRRRTASRSPIGGSGRTSVASRFVNGFAPFFQKPPDIAVGNYFIPGDVHFSAQGHRLLFEELKRSVGLVLSFTGSIRGSITRHGLRIDVVLGDTARRRDLLAPAGRPTERGAELARIAPQHVRALPDCTATATPLSDVATLKAVPVISTSMPLAATTNGRCLDGTSSKKACPASSQTPRCEAV